MPQLPQRSTLGGEILPPGNSAFCSVKDQFGRRLEAFQSVPQEFIERINRRKKNAHEILVGPQKCPPGHYTQISAHGIKFIKI